MRHRWVRIALALAAVAIMLLAGWAIYAQVTALTYGGLVDRLRGEGATVQQTGTVSQPFFSASGRVLRVNGQDVQVFEYPVPLLAARDAANVSPDGSTIGNTQVDWIEPPLFFTSGRLVVVYVGHDAGVIRLLTEALGPPFAGART